MKKFFLTIPLLFQLALPIEAATKASDVLKQSDATLIPPNCSYELSLSTFNDNQSVQKFRGYKKGDDKNMMVITDPKRVAGSVHMRKENVIWTYFTTTSKLTQMSYHAIFMGTLLNYGDIMSTELSRDYAIKTAKKIKDEYELTLAPKKKEGGYGSIILTIDAKTFYPKIRKYYALSGILLKEATFTKLEREGNKLKVLEMEFSEPLKGRKTLVQFSNIKLLKDVPEKYFNESNLQNLSGI